MLQNLPIHDLFVREIPAREEQGLTRWLALRDADHLLRRFGQAEVLRLSPESIPALRCRAVADEVWCLLEGQIACRWRDTRNDSPSKDAVYSTTFDRPALMLVPFGVAFGCRALTEGCLLLRISTHADGEHEGDRTLPWEADA